jgi:TRAP-type uncharacterized transport system substrate-binding protein
MDYGPLTGVSAIMGNMDTEHVLSYFTKDFVDKTGISTLEELVAQKYPVNIACKTKGSMGEKATEMAFKLLGVSYDDIKSWGGTISFLEAQQAANLIKDGKADLMIDATTVGQAITTELSLTKDLVFLSWATSCVISSSKLG